MCRGGSLELDQKAGEVDQESEMPALRKLLLQAARANQEAVDTLTTPSCFFCPNFRLHRQKELYCTEWAVVVSSITYK